MKPKIVDMDWPTDVVTERPNCGDCDKSGGCGGDSEPTGPVWIPGNFDDDNEPKVWQ